MIDIKTLPEAELLLGTGPAAFEVVRGSRGTLGFRFQHRGCAYEVTSVSPHYPGDGATGVLLSRVDGDGHLVGEPIPAYLSAPN